MPLKPIRKRFDLLSPILDERTRRLWAATEAIVFEHGGITATSRATAISRRAITKGYKELREAKLIPMPSAVRRPGGGRKRLEDKYPDIRDTLDPLREPVTRGDPESPLRSTCKSVRVLAIELGKMGIQVSRVAVTGLLKDMGYSLQANKKLKEGSFHPDRDTRFKYIYEQVEIFQENHQPIISFDPKKKELGGDFKNAGRQWQPKGKPERVRVHDFALESGKVAPYGVYDLAENAGCVNLGTDHDTSAFAVESIRRWWHKMGKEVYPKATRLLITDYSGGSNGY